MDVINNPQEVVYFIGALFDYLSNFCEDFVLSVVLNHNQLTFIIVSWNIIQNFLFAKL